MKQSISPKRMISPFKDIFSQGGKTYFFFQRIFSKKSNQINPKHLIHSGSSGLATLPCSMWFIVAKCWHNYSLVNKFIWRPLEYRYFATIWVSQVNIYLSSNSSWQNFLCNCTLFVLCSSAPYDLVCRDTLQCDGCRHRISVATASILATLIALCVSVMITDTNG